MPEAHTGKRARCRQCGEMLVLQAADSPADTIPLSESVHPPDESTSPAAGPTEPQGLLGRGQARFDARPQDSGFTPPSQPLSVPGVRGTYLWDIVWTLLLLTDPSHLASFVLIWVLLSVQGLVLLIPFVGLFLALVIEGWFGAICLNVVAAAANGEEELPIWELTGSLWDDIVVPVFKFLAATLPLVLPVYYCLLFLLRRATPGPGLTLWDHILGTAFYGDYTGLAGMISSDPLFFLLPVLVCAGLFLWPMMLLVVAVGGFSALVRVDLMLITIARSFPTYLCTVALVFSAAGVFVGLAVLALLSSKPGLSGLWLVAILATGLRGYAQIVAMRVIGLYYHHFKKCFAWSWG